MGVGLPNANGNAKRIRPVSDLEIRRRSLGLSQAALAARIEVSDRYIGLIEGGYRPPAHVRGAIAAVLGAEVADLWPEAAK
jgi:predicted transcriptional regulator